MRQICYKVKVSYRDFDNQLYTVPYELYAYNESDAQNIVKELFCISYGSFANMNIQVQPKQVSDEEKAYINKVLIEEYGAVKSQFNGMTYKAFLDAFSNFMGYCIGIKPNFVSFWFRFQHIECRAVWANGESYISEEEIIVHDKRVRTYLVKDNLCNIYVTT